jgi:tRNA 2-selenouridine synthase
MSDDITDFHRLFLEDVPMMDVRAPVEFAKGSFPWATNLPLMNDEDRHLIGIRYAEAGQQAAIALGHERVCGDIREQRTRDWLAFIDANPQGCLYCFRGGLRSRTVQQWLAERGVDYPLVRGGYKAMRRYLLERLEADIAALPLQILAGRTGTGKTRVIEVLEQAIDLEGLAHHRGSSFGRRPGGQPAQIDFENALAVDLLKHAARHANQPVILEDESRLIGRCHLPLSLQERMKDAPRVIIEESVEHRVEVTLEDYVISPLAEYRHWYGEQQAAWKLGEELLAAIDRIRRRLGGARHRDLREKLQYALDVQHSDGKTALHRDWIRPLLTGYYDPMYDYMMGKRQGRVLFQGTREAVLQWLKETAPHGA